MAEQSQDKTRVVFPVGGRALTFHLDQIAWLQARRNCTVLWVGNQAHPVRKPLKRVLAELASPDFVQVHRSRAVNVKNIKDVRFWVCGHHEILLSSGETIIASRRRVEALKAFSAGKSLSPAIPG
jgi:DNA-binding LytR/AlgR family response regulator